MKKWMVLCVVSSLTCLGSLRPLYGAIAELPTAGLATASIVVGVLGAADGVTGATGGGWLQRVFVGVTGTGLVVVDPPSGTFYNGQIVMDYPDNLLSLAYVGWFGNFASDSSLPVPPVTSSESEQLGFYDAPPNTYTWNEPANPALGATVTNSGGVVTVSFNDPGGVAANAAGAGDFNFVDMAFTNISGSELSWATVGSANLFEDNAMTSFTCTPVNGVRGNCGANAPVVGFAITAVPEPDTLPLLGAGLFALFVCRRRSQKSTDCAIYSWKKRSTGSLRLSAG